MMNTYRQQLVLLYLGYNPGSPDGIRGTMTADAIEDFQRDNGLTHDRIWGAKTEAKARYNFDHDVFKPEQEAVDTTTPVTDTGKAPSTAASDKALGCVATNTTQRCRVLPPTAPTNRAGRRISLSGAYLMLRSPPTWQLQKPTERLLIGTRLPMEPSTQISEEAL